MPRCELSDTCMFSNNKLPCDSSLGAIYKRHYCNSDYANCALYMVAKALSRDSVPTNLYPSQQDRARELIAKAAQKKSGARK